MSEVRLGVRANISRLYVVSRVGCMFVQSAFEYALVQSKSEDVKG